MPDVNGTTALAVGLLVALASCTSDTRAGQAVFVPSGSGRYEMRWITTGPSVNGVRVGRDGPGRGALAAASGMAGWVPAARASLAPPLRRPWLRRLRRRAPPFQRRGG